MWGSERLWGSLVEVVGVWWEIGTSSPTPSPGLMGLSNCLPEWEAPRYPPVGWKVRGAFKTQAAGCVKRQGGVPLPEVPPPSSPARSSRNKLTTVTFIII